ncbi:MAG: FAD-binding protein [Legionellaceae bacterium]|nr:FAD-binding protein [Legionellaceae bacterium]
MSTLVIIEHDNQKPSPANAAVLAAAGDFACAAIAVVLGSDCQSVAEEVAQLEGVESVWLIDSPVFAHTLAEPVAQVLAPLAAEFQYILAPASTFGKNCLPRLAALLDRIQISDVTKIVDKKTVEHPIYAGNAIEQLAILDDKVCMSIRTTAFTPVSAAQSMAPIKVLPSQVVWDKTTFVNITKTPSERPELTNATCIVAGGRALQSAEKFRLIEELADALGGAVGASRAAVDAGFAPNDYQVGQTGKIVAPTLYIAVGISGAIQHLAGMKDSRLIVAINKDPDAPIFQVANYGLVGDLFEIVPQLITLIKERG